MGKQAKRLRSQVKNVFQENLEQVLTKDLAKEIEAHVMARVSQHLEAIQKRVESVLAEVDERSKNTAAFVQRQALSAPVTTGSILPTR